MVGNLKVPGKLVVCQSCKKRQIWQMLSVQFTSGGANLGTKLHFTRTTCWYCYQHHLNDWQLYQLLMEITSLFDKNFNGPRSKGGFQTFTIFNFWIFFLTVLCQQSAIKQMERLSFIIHFFIGFISSYLIFLPWRKIKNIMLQIRICWNWGAKFVPVLFKSLFATMALLLGNCKRITQRDTHLPWVPTLYTAYISWSRFMNKSPDKLYKIWGRRERLNFTWVKILGGFYQTAKHRKILP